MTGSWASWPVTSLPPSPPPSSASMVLPLSAALRTLPGNAVGLGDLQDETSVATLTVAAASQLTTGGAATAAIGWALRARGAAPSSSETFELAGYRVILERLGE